MSINSVVIVQDRQCRGKSHFQDPCRVRLHQNGSHRFQKAEISQVFISNAVLRNNFRDIYKTKGTIFSHFVLLLQYISNINFEPPWLKTDQLFSKRTWGFSTHFFFKYGLILNGSQYFIIWIQIFFPVDTCSILQIKKFSWLSKERIRRKYLNLFAKPQKLQVINWKLLTKSNDI